MCMGQCDETTIGNCLRVGVGVSSEMVENSGILGGLVI